VLLISVRHGGEDGSVGRKEGGSEGATGGGNPVEVDGARRAGAEWGGREEALASPGEGSSGGGEDGGQCSAWWHEEALVVPGVEAVGRAEEGEMAAVLNAEPGQGAGEHLSVLK
jgi:hypothetical protein